MNALIAYESRGGTTEAVALEIAAAVRGAGVDVTATPMRAVSPEQAAAADLLFVGTWVQGLFIARVGPAHAATRWLEHLPPLNGKPVAIFCTYAFHPRGTLPAMRSLLESKGASVVAQQSTKRNHPLRGVEAFAHTTIAAAREESPR